MNLKIVFSILTLIIFNNAKSQDYKFVYYMDENLSSTEKDKALIIGKGYKQEAHFVLDCFSKATEKKVLTLTFIDSSLGTLDGPYRSYFDGVKLESEGNYTDNEMNGVWKNWNKYGLITDSIQYNMGNKMTHATYYYTYNQTNLRLTIPKDSLKYMMNYLPKDYSDSIGYTGYQKRYNFTDSLRSIFIEKGYTIANGKEKLDFEVYFTGQRGLLKEYDSTGNVKTDSVFDRTLVEAKYEGGEDAWRDFLRKNLNRMVGVEKGVPDGKYTVIIKFIINENGSLEDIRAENNPGYGLAQEAIRVINKSAGKWKPAIQYGRPCKAYRRQPVTFVYETN